MNDHTPTAFETEAAALAAEMAQDIPGFQLPSLEDRRSADTSSPQGAASGGTGANTTTPPAAGGQTPAAETQTKEDEGAPDPLAGIKLETILGHKELGPQLQSRIDSTVATQTARRVEAERPKIKESVERESLVEYLKGLEPSERARVLAEDGDSAIVWGQEAERAKAAENASDPANLAYAAQVFSYKTAIETTTGMIDKSALPDDIKTQLKTVSKEEVEAGPAGLVSWQQRVHTALVKADVDAQLPTMRESEREQAAAAAGRTRPGATPPGTIAPVVTNDPKVTPVADMWDSAFDRLERQQSRS